MHERSWLEQNNLENTIKTLPCQSPKPCSQSRLTSIFPCFGGDHCGRPRYGQVSISKVDMVSDNLRDTNDKEDDGSK